MQSTRSRVLQLFLVLSLAASLFGQANTQPQKGTVEHIKVHGKSLEGNLEGDSQGRDVFSSLYIMSGCCLINNPGGQANRGAAAPAAAPPAAAGQGAAGQRGQGNRGGGFANAGSAQAAAWASNPKNPPDFFDLPVK